MITQNVLGVLLQFLRVMFLIPEFPLRVVSDSSPCPRFDKLGVLSAAAGLLRFPRRTRSPEGATIILEGLSWALRAELMVWVQSLQDQFLVLL